MRSNKRLSVLALVVVAAGLSLTACGPDDSSASGTTSSPSASDPALSSSASGATSTPSAEPSQDGSSGSGSTSGGSSGGSGSGSKSSSSGGGSSSSKSGGSGMCQTSNLAISAEHGMSGEGMELVNFKNIGSSSCTMHGFAGADLKNGSDSVSVSRRSGGDVPTVELAPGEENGFVLYYPYNNSGGSGYTFTTMTVTPPNETHSKTISAAINIPVTSQNSKSAGSGISMYAVGAGK